MILAAGIKPFGYVILSKKEEKQGKDAMEAMSKIETIDFRLHKYASYEEYRDFQIFYNKQKIDKVWADRFTLNRVAKILTSKFGEVDKIRGLCHGSRNGFEQNYLRSLSKKIEAIGTDISDTANDYENSVQWDFHDKKAEWYATNNFVYTNALDHSWQPKQAISTWLSQLTEDGVLIIELAKSHGPHRLSKSDPFGIRPTDLPYVLTIWFGSQISISHSVAK